MIATGDMDGQVRIWDAQSGVLRLTLANNSSNDWISSLAWSKNGKRIAATNDKLRVWDAETGRLVFNLEGHRGFVDAVVWSPDNNNLVSAGTDGTIRI